jgi:hypothetical protein
MAGSWQYPGAYLKRLISPLSSVDPSPADFDRLTSGPAREIILAVLSVGPNKTTRAQRLDMELGARQLVDSLGREIADANAEADLASLQPENWDAIDLGNILSEKIPPVCWVVRPWLARPGLYIFFGKPKSLKSILLTDMVLHICSGLPWLTRPETGKDGFEVNQMRVIWLDLENGQRVVKIRMRAIARVLAIPEAAGRLVLFSLPINRINGLGGIGVLVIDHLNLISGQTEENSALMAMVMGNLRLISEKCDVCIILVHHSKKFNKNSGGLDDQLRGSGAIMAAVDGCYLLERDELNRSLVQLVPVATRGPDCEKTSAQFSYTQDKELDLEEARFWRADYLSAYDKVRNAIFEVLTGEKKNYTQLMAAVKKLQPKLSDKLIRDMITELESEREITFATGGHGAKIYSLAGGGDGDES